MRDPSLNTKLPITSSLRPYPSITTSRGEVGTSAVSLSSLSCSLAPKPCRKPLAVRDGYKTSSYSAVREGGCGGGTLQSIHCLVPADLDATIRNAVTDYRLLLDQLATLWYKAGTKGNQFVYVTHDKCLPKFYYVVVNVMVYLDLISFIGLNKQE